MYGVRWYHSTQYCTALFSINISTTRSTMSTRLRRSIKAAVVWCSVRHARLNSLFRRDTMSTCRYVRPGHTALASTLPLVDLPLCPPALAPHYVDLPLCPPALTDATLCRPATMSTRAHVTTRNLQHTRAHTAPVRRQRDARGRVHAPSLPTNLPWDGNTGAPQRGAAAARKTAKKGAGVRTEHSRTFVLGSRVESITRRSRRS